MASFALCLLEHIPISATHILNAMLVKWNQFVRPRADFDAIRNGCIFCQMVDDSYLTDAKRLEAGFAVFTAFLLIFSTKYSDYTATFAV